MGKLTAIVVASSSLLVPSTALACRCGGMCACRGESAIELVVAFVLGLGVSALWRRGRA